MPTFFDVNAIAEEMAAGRLIICSNQRLASRLQNAYATFSRQHYGHSVVDTPRVYSLDAWIELSWQQLLLAAHPLALAYTVLSHSQQHVVWEQIIEASGLALLRPAATAQQAAAAYKTLIYWQQDVSSSQVRKQFSNDEDASTFLSWVDTFIDRCSTHNYLPAAKIPELLLDLYQSGELTTGEPVLLVGFESLSPLEQALLDQLGPLTHYHAQKSSSVHIFSCESQQQELYAAATWAKQQLKNSPEHTVAVVVPDLVQQRGRVQRIFQEVFEPDFSDPAVARRSLPFNISAAYSLREAPLINAAIDGLSLSLPEIDLDTCYAVISSPFYRLAAEDELLIARLYTQLAELRQSRISSAMFRRLTNKVGEASGGNWQFSEALQQQSRILRAGPDNATTAYWADFIAKILAAIGWPGQRKLDSVEYQQLMQWQLALDDFASLGPVPGKINYTQALALLNGLLTRQIFQPQTAESSLQVLGVLEAAGLQFDHLWLLSMSDQQWPASPSPNYLLPYAMQRECNMPHATAERELEFSTQLLERFTTSANNIIASYCSFEDGNAIKASPLINHYPRATEIDILGKPLKSLVPTIEIRRRHLETSAVEYFDPGPAPVLKEHELVRGGSYLFASQSACPFRAFARHRLHIEALPGPETGLNAADRGTLIHRALELIWAHLKDQDKLLGLGSDAQQALCQSTAEYALNDFESKKTISIGPRFRSLECQRIASLLSSWLDTEKQRAHFIVKSREAKHTFRFAQLQLETRIDRIDQLDDGSQLIIDYKTSKNINVNRWWSDRPDEPQLPLYNMLLAKTEDISGIAFAKVHIEGNELLGVGSELSPEPSIRFNNKLKSQAAVENWQQLGCHWQRVLETLAQDFINGVASVDPKNPTTTCNYCDLSAVCRINHIKSDNILDDSA